MDDNAITMPIKESQLNAEGHACNEAIRGRVQSLHRDHYGRSGLTLIRQVREFCDWWQSFERENSNKIFRDYIDNPPVGKPR